MFSLRKGITRTGSVISHGRLILCSDKIIADFILQKFNQTKTVISLNDRIMVAEDESTYKVIINEDSDSENDLTTTIMSNRFSNSEDNEDYDLNNPASNESFVDSENDDNVNPSTTKDKKFHQKFKSYKDITISDQNEWKIINSILQGVILNGSIIIGVPPLSLMSFFMTLRKDLIYFCCPIDLELVEDLDVAVSNIAKVGRFHALGNLDIAKLSLHQTIVYLNNYTSSSGYIKFINFDNSNEVDNNDDSKRYGTKEEISNF
jgi:hypothetical protein